MDSTNNDTWTPAAALGHLRRYPSENVSIAERTLNTHLIHALDPITQLESLLTERERALARQMAWSMVLEIERNQVQRLYNTQSAEVARLRAGQEEG